MMNAELTAENKPACVLPGSAFSTGRRNPATYEDEGCIQVLIVLPHVTSVKLFRFPPINGEEVSPWVIGPQWIKKFLKGGMEAGYWGISVAWSAIT